MVRINRSDRSEPDNRIIPSIGNITSVLTVQIKHH